MTHVYIVRCNFTAPDKEAAWNGWYSGPKIEQMLKQPHFLSCQRFRRAAGSGRDYLALWALASPEALKTAAYTAQWGFAEWEGFVTDWSRDLFDGGGAPAADFAVERDGALEVVSFDGIGAHDAGAVNAAIAKLDPKMTWLPIAGLDRHTPVIGLRALSAGSRSVPQGDDTITMQHATYRPICDFQTAARQATA